MKIDKKLPFTHNDVLNRDLVIEMLTYENSFGRGEGQEIYKTFTDHDLEPSHIINRNVLSHFNFSSTDESVQMYRTIFRNYYNSPTDYDKEVLDSVYYMKNNKCVYYTEPKLTINDKLINCGLLTLNNESTSLFSIINSMSFDHLFLCAFSMS